MKTKDIVLVHGSWHGGWCWDDPKKILQNKGFRVYAPTLRGMESKQDPDSKTSGLLSHIDQVVGLIERENLDSIVLVGHSYGGMVITGVAHKIPDRIGKLVYLDAFLPEDNQSLFDISLPERVEAMKKSLVDDTGKTLEQGAREVWLLPERDPATFGITDPQQAEWLADHMVPTPVLTFEEKVSANNPAVQNIKKAYIRCTECSIVERFENKAQSLGYSMYSIKTGHDAMILDPVGLSDMLEEITNHS